MTSRSDNLKTNEFHRLRMLRLQQVREQSKDIARKIRQRAKVEQLRHVTAVDINKEKAYLQQQEKLVNRLEDLYIKGLQNVGASHKNASELAKPEISAKKDLSKLRGKEAIAVLKQKKQETLDAQKKILVRKLHAREVANVLSRDKFNVVANALMKSSSNKGDNEIIDKAINDKEPVIGESEETNLEKSAPATKNDMGTQWEFEEIPNEWEPNIPILPIPTDDSLKNSANDNMEKSDKTKRLNLFALSDEMPSSLRGGVTSLADDRVPIKPSLTLVSEYLQNRGLRLRETDTTHLHKKSSDDLQSVKQTLLRTRASRTDGSLFPNICHVLDQQVIPLPCWRAERRCQFCSEINNQVPQHYQKKISNNKSLRCMRPGFQHRLLNYEKPNAYTASHRCHQEQKIPVSGRSNNIEQCNKLDYTNKRLMNKSSVTMYDHNTRDTRDLLHNVDNFVVRDPNTDDDAYSQALKETSVTDNNSKPRPILQQELRNRVALTRENVNKEYRDTLAFLSSLPKEKPPESIRTAYMDGDRQQELNERRQQKLQQAYKKVEKQCSKHHCKNARSKYVVQEQNRSKSKSPMNKDLDHNIINRDFQYSWLPVPESDGSMAIHTIKDNKNDKPGNTVKFSSVDTYHEYRSRHKHTPPTKDVNNEPNKRVVEAVIIQEDSNDSMDSSFETDTSSIENLQVKENNLVSHKTHKDKQLGDAEKIIIYKVMESKDLKKHKSKKKLQREINVDTNYNTLKKPTDVTQVDCEEVTNNGIDTDKVKSNSVSFTQLKEGVYKSMSVNGDNIASLDFSDDDQEEKRSPFPIKKGYDDGASTRTVLGENNLNRNQKHCDNCKSINSHQHPSAATSTSSFKTAVNDKAHNAPLDDGYIKFVEEGGQDTGKFYVGASGFLKDDAYEVIIQLRKKEVEKSSEIISKDKNITKTGPLPEELIENSNKVHHQSTITQVNDDQVNNSFFKNGNQDEKSKTPLLEQFDLLSPLKPNRIQHEIPATETKNSPQISSLESGFKKDKSSVEIPQIIDKGVSTTISDTFAIPENVPHIDPVLKTVTSNYTQTTQNSPFPRPILMHLSSSTSTTYMSPPELVLPRYFRKGGSDSCDDTYDPVSSNFNSQSTRVASYKSCRCGKCKKREKRSKPAPPPNTSRSTEQAKHKIINDKQYNKFTKADMRYVRQHKCEIRSESKICSKKKLKRCSSEHKCLHSRSNYTSNKKGKINNNVGKVNLNPVVETYIKRLLALNKEGLKAINVVNQECSVVNTPCSSIINVPNNINKNESLVCSQISLEQIKNNFKQQILRDIRDKKNISSCTVKTTGSQTDKMMKLLYKSNKKRPPVHKVKSFNISKQLLKANKESQRQSVQSTATSTTPCFVNTKLQRRNYECSNIKNSNRQSIDTPTSRKICSNRESSNNTLHSESHKVKTKHKIKSTKTNTVGRHYSHNEEMHRESESYRCQSHRATTTCSSESSEASNVVRGRRNFSTPPISISTQTNQVDSEVEFMKLAENKLQNMEKIADLTEKCTKRLSNLAKVLEEVRRNKSLAYSQISSSDSLTDSDHRSDKNLQTVSNTVKTFNPFVQIATSTEMPSPLLINSQDTIKRDAGNISTYIPILTDLPKPVAFKTSTPFVSSDSNMTAVDIVKEQQYGRNRGKPPAALKRINLKHIPEALVIPHELSTVVEVDSPMSVKLKSHTTQIDNKHDDTHMDSVDDNNLNDGGTNTAPDIHNKVVDPTSQTAHYKKYNIKTKTQYTDSSDDSKIKMMDLKHFNEIMLKPFISVKEYAKQYNIEERDTHSSLNGVLKDENPKDEFSSLHSEASLPDIMAELLKRNLISEPFKFETTSNVNSTTMSSESTLSLLALSNVHKDKKKSTMLVKNKENIAETTVSLSISSNPDLEQAFQRLGLGWASSTLKKTKERLALSSSSNTSSSSVPQFQIKSFNYQDIPELSSLLNISNKEEVITPQENLNDTPKNALQQTSLTNSMTVKEFLANELAKKITFSNKTTRNTTEDEFISLCETKMPEEMKQLSQKFEEPEKSVDSIPSGGNNRARTSTPVQIYKSMTYHSTSSSNTSNGLFSNVDDLSSVKGTSNSIKNHSTSDKDDLTIPNYSLKMRKETS